MKNFISILAFLAIGQMAFAQPDWEHIEINYDQVLNLLSVTYDVCRDPCTGTNEAFCDREDCIKTCIEDFQNGTITGLEGLANCIEGCGESVPSETAREPVGFSYRVIAAWNNIPFHPWNNEDDWVEFTGTGTPNANGEIIIPSFTLPEPWPDIHTGHNTCYGIGIRVFYDDFTFCDFTEWNCNIVG